MPSTNMTGAYWRAVAEMMGATVVRHDEHGVRLLIPGRGVYEVIDNGGEVNLARVETTGVEGSIPATYHEHVIGPVTMANRILYRIDGEPIPYGHEVTDPSE